MLIRALCVIFNSTVRHSIEKETSRSPSHGTIIMQTSFKQILSKRLKMDALIKLSEPRDFSGCRF